MSGLKSPTKEQLQKNCLAVRLLNMFFTNTVGVKFIFSFCEFWQKAPCTFFKKGNKKILFNKN
jgi:hypothetical protein